MFRQVFYRLARPAFVGAAFCAFWTAAFVTSASAQSTAVVIGVSEYDEESFVDLDFCYNDAEEMAKVLKAAGFKVKRVYARDDSEADNLVPTKSNVEKALKSAFSGCYEDDVALVYFSGHGTKAGEPPKERSLVVLKDSEPDVDTQIYVQDVREILKDCPSERKILILDSCCAGGTRDAFDMTNNYAAENELDGVVDGVVTLASCKVEQESINFPGKTHISLFTYWLVEGLKGFADVDGDEELAVSTDELFNYASRNIEAMQKRDAHTPIVVKTGATKHFSLATPPARSLERTLDDYASHLVALGESVLKIDSLHIEDFDSVGSKWANAREQNQTKALADFSPAALKRKIENRGAKFKVTLGSTRGSVDAVFRCSFRRDESVKSEGDVFYVSSDLYVGSEKAEEMPARVYAEQAIETNEVDLETEQYGAYDDLVAGLPDFDICVRNPDGTFSPRKTRQIDGVDWIAFEPGDVYKLAFSACDREYGVRVLIDGRSSLPADDGERDPVSKFVVVGPAPSDDDAEEAEGSAAVDDYAEAAEGSATVDDYAEAAEGSATVDDYAEPDVAPTLLDYARYWITRPFRWEVGGFAQKDRKTAKAFTVVDASDYLDPDDCTDQMGVITVAFYEMRREGGPALKIPPPPVPRNLITEPGQELAADRRAVKGCELGVLLKCYQIRYATAEAIDELANPSAVTR